MSLLDTEINVIIKDGKPQRIEVNGNEIPCVTKFQYNADESIDITLCGNVKFVEETHYTTTKEFAEERERQALLKYSMPAKEVVVK